METNLKKSSEKRRKDPLTWIRELKDELKKVSWASKAELVSGTKVVIGSMFFLGIGIYVVDLVIKGILELVKGSILFIFG